MSIWIWKYSPVALMTKRIKVVDTKGMMDMSGGLLIMWLFFIEKL